MAKTTGKHEELSIDEPSIEESLELFRAFKDIKTAADRQKVIELAERLSGSRSRG